VAPGLLAALAGVQIALAFGAHLSPWKGGGFGMFSTLDHGGFRGVEVTALLPEGERRLAVPPERVREMRRARTLPTRGALLGLARALAPELPEARAVRVRVFRIAFEPGDLRPVRRPLAEVTWERPAQAPTRRPGGGR
jgi:hypothetical protein